MPVYMMVMFNSGKSIKNSYLTKKIKFKFKLDDKTIQD